MRFRHPAIAAPLGAILLAIMLVGCGGGNQCTVSKYELAKKAALDTVQAGRFDGGRMWTFDYPPLEWFKEAYNFKADNAWMNDVRMSALRFANYCSASFVSADGLVMTNHHCARQSVEGVTQPGEHLIQNGFWAPTLADERKVKDLYLDQLVKVQDVSDEVIAAMEKGATDKEKLEFRQKALDEIQKRLEGEAPGLRVQMVTLYSGGRYSAYFYKRYTDVRLVFAPEVSIGFYGGDWDNFTYPRYDVDCSFFRVYDNDKPLKTENFFKWSAAGAVEGELVFVVGNPGGTTRLRTMEQLAYDRDYQVPFIANMLNGRVAVLRAFMAKHPEKQEDMLNDLFSMANSQKVYNGQLAALNDDVLMQRRRDFNRKFRAAVDARPDLKAKYGPVWDDIAASREAMSAVAGDFFGLRMSGMGAAAAFGKAFGIARFAAELQKPEEERAKAYQGNGLQLVRKTLAKPVRFKADEFEADMEELNLVQQLRMMQAMLGADDPVVRAALQGQTPEAAATRMLAQTILTDSLKVADLVAGAPESIDACADPFVVIARMAVPRFMKAVEVMQRGQAGDAVNEALLGRAMYDVYGTSIPPDANMTLRISDGVVKGYEYNGTIAPAYTTFYGMYDRHYSFPKDSSWYLPKRWLDRPAEFDLSTPANFVSTNDIIGGNSGSPMINTKKEVVGLIFDGNIESLSGEYIFSEETNNRTVSVHSSGILQAVRHIYKAERLARELENSGIK
jgi:hypothetical protein